jgi:murein DD-endopeptidase MepM/ murein hydrolase activator NlpD
LRRRRRFFREEVLAPWLTLLVVSGLWWGGWVLVGRPDRAPVSTPDGSPADRARGIISPTPRREEPVPDAPETHAIIESARSSRADALPVVGDEELRELRSQDLAVPVLGIRRADIVSNFDDHRGSGRAHEALDLLAPRGTPVVAVEDGHIEKLSTSLRGGLSIYQFDHKERYCFYYAHLDRYADGLKEGQPVRRGQVIGYVGTSGNAPPDTPHLHFAILRLSDAKEWWDETPLDPAVVLR